jgi:DNA polymerase-3 subunit delta'
VLLTAADRLTPEAANALLVTLEEPPSHALILLTADNPAAVLPTVRSRCLLIQLTAVPDKEFTPGLDTTLAAGRPGRAIRYCNDEAFAKRIDSLRSDVETWRDGAVPQRLALAARYGVDRDSTTSFLDEVDLALPLSWRQGLIAARRRLARNVTPRAALEAFAMLST